MLLMSSLSRYRNGLSSIIAGEIIKRLLVLSECPISRLRNGTVARGASLFGQDAFGWDPEELAEVHRGRIPQVT